jgi:hypothetical protein
MHYRVAFVEAFRKRGIYPRDLRTLSPDSLLWRTPDTDEVRPSASLQKGLERLQGYVPKSLFGPDGTPPPRHQIFELQREMRLDLHQWLEQHLSSGPDGANDARFLGIDPGQKFEVHMARFALRPTPDGDLDAQFLMGVLQTTTIPSDPSMPGSAPMPFEGGSTVIADLRRLKIRYCVRKNISSVTRKARQQNFEVGRADSPRATYFSTVATLEPFAAMHRGMER